MAAIRHASVVLAVALSIAVPEAARVGGQPAATPGVSGTWSLNTYLSDSPQQIANELRYDIEQSGQELMRGVPGGILGSGREGRSRSGRSAPESSGPSKPIAPDDRRMLDELTEAIRFAPTSLTISQNGSDVVSIATPLHGTQTLHTNGKSEKYPVAGGTVDRVARWEGLQLTVTYNVGHAGTLRYSYALAPNGKQLLVRVNFERTTGQPGPFEIKLVYDSAPQQG